MHPVAKVLALLEGLTPDDLAALSPAQRERFGAICRHWAAAAEPRREAPNRGVLADLGDGRGRQ